MSEALNGPSLLEGTQSVSVCPEPCFKAGAEQNNLHFAHPAVLQHSMAELNNLLDTSKLHIPEILGACCHVDRPDGCQVQSLCLPYLIEIQRKKLA